MKNTKPIYLAFIVWSTILSSCANKGVLHLPSYIDTDKIINIQGDTVLDNSLSQINNPSQFWAIGDSILFTDFDKEYTYSLICVSGDSVAGRLGVIGDGPGQLLRPARIQTDSDGNTYIFDDVKRILYIQPTFKRFLEDMDSVVSIRFKNLSGGCLVRTATGYVGDNLYGDGRIFTLFDYNGNIKTSFGNVPGTVISEHVNPDFYMSYQVSFDVSPDKKHMCVAGAYHDWLAFFDVSGDNPSLIQEYFAEGPIITAGGKDEQFHIGILPETVEHYLNIAPYNDGVFLNYIGATHENIEKGKVSSAILHYDWDGKLKGVLLPKERVGELTATPDGRYLYATFRCDDDESIKLVRYDLINHDQ